MVSLASTWYIFVNAFILLALEMERTQWWLAKSDKIHRSLHKSGFVEVCLVLESVLDFPKVFINVFPNWHCVM